MVAWAISHLGWPLITFGLTGLFLLIVFDVVNWWRNRNANPIPKAELILELRRLSEELFEFLQEWAARPRRIDHREVSPDAAQRHVAWLERSEDTLADGQWRRATIHKRFGSRMEAIFARLTDAGIDVPPKIRSWARNDLCTEDAAKYFGAQAILLERIAAPAPPAAKATVSQSIGVNHGVAQAAGTIINQAPQPQFIERSRALRDNGNGTQQALLEFEIKSLYPVARAIIYARSPNIHGLRVMPATTGMMQGLQMGPGRKPFELCFSFQNARGAYVAYAVIDSVEDIAWDWALETS